MAIRNTFLTLLKRKEESEQRDIPLSRIEKDTGVSRRTLARWRDQKVKSFDAPTLEALCDYFNCEPGDLLIRVKDPEQGDQ